MFGCSQTTDNTSYRFNKEQEDSLLVGNNLFVAKGDHIDPNRVSQLRQRSVTEVMVSPMLDTLEPSQFLRFLETLNGSNRFVMLIPDNPTHPDKIQGINRVPTGWLGRNDLDTLFMLVDDNTPTSPVYSIYANAMPHCDPTSKGIEAVRLIQGFRNKQYPSLWPNFHLEDSASTRLDSIKSELRVWWAAQSK